MHEVGNLPPEITLEPPGPRSRELSRDLGRFEAPGINTLAGGEASLLWHEAVGSNVVDVDGNRFVDLTSGFGVAAVGHRHPRVVEAIRRQSAVLLHGLGDVHAHPRRPALARRLAEIAPVAGESPVVHFAISGADAVEIALKTVLLDDPRRPGVVAFEPAYHGLTLGALAATSRPDFREPFAPWLNPHVSTLPFAAPTEQLAEHLDLHPEIGAVLFEPIAGREGILVPPDGWLGELVEVARARRVKVIADEIFTGCGRTGRWFAVEHDNARPDLIACGKALGGGLPIGAVVGGRELMAAWRTTGEARHTATSVGHPLACAAAWEVIEVVESENLLAGAAEVGSRIAARRERWRRCGVEELRGRGAIWGAEVATPNLAKAWAGEAMQRGVLLLAGGASGRVVQLAPPLVIAPALLETALDLAEEALTAASHR
ncbi:MAG: aminotransferase class III-fold pyridoxal phosphate-dependent enzyme [Acidobacteriota bacterium]